MTYHGFPTLFRKRTCICHYLQSVSAGASLYLSINLPATSALLVKSLNTFLKRLFFGALVNVQSPETM